MYNQKFKNNEYLFEDIYGVKVAQVMNYSWPFLARDDKNGKRISDGEKYLLKSHTEEIPTITGECSFDSIIPFRIKSTSNSKD